MRLFNPLCAFLSLVVWIKYDIKLFEIGRLAVDVNFNISGTKVVPNFAYMYFPLAPQSKTIAYGRRG